MTRKPEEALNTQVPKPPNTRKPLSILEATSAVLGALALLLEIARRFYPELHDGTGYIWLYSLMALSFGVTTIHGLPILLKEFLSNRRSPADYYMIFLFIFCLAGSLMEAGRNLEEHFLGVLPILFAGYAICKRKYRDYNDSLEAAARDVQASQKPEIVLITDAVEGRNIRLEEVKTGDQLKVVTGQRIWVPGIIISGFALVNQSSPQGNPIARRCRTGDSVIPGEIVIQGTLIIQTTENGKPLPEGPEESHLPWLEQFNNLSFNKRHNLYRIIWVNCVVGIICFQFAHSFFEGNWHSAIMPSIALGIGLNPWGIMLIAPLLWRRRFTITAYKGIRFQNLKLVELFNKPLEVVIEKVGVITQDGIQKKTIILSKHFHGKSQFLIRALEAIEEEAQYSLGTYYFSKGPSSVEITIKQIEISPDGCLEAEIYDEEEHGVFLRAGTLRSMPYFTHEGFKQLNAQSDGKPPRQRLFVTLNDIPAAIFSWDEKVNDSGITFLKEAQHHNLPIHILTLDSRSRFEQFNGIKVEKCLSAEEKLRKVSIIQKRKKLVMYIGNGRTDTPALAASATGMVMENGDPLAQIYSDAILSEKGLENLVDEWSRFRRAYKVSTQITAITLIQATIILSLAVSQLLSPWIATLITGLTGTINLVQALRLEKS